MEEKSPYARPLKQMNAVRQGQSWQMYEDDTNTDPGKPPGERVKDENLTVKQLMYRYSGNARQAVIKCHAIMFSIWMNKTLTMFPIWKIKNQNQNSCKLHIKISGLQYLVYDTWLKYDDLI